MQLHHIAIGVPRGNGQVERLMRTIFNLMRATLTAEKEKTRTTVIPAIEDNLNSTTHSITGHAPKVLHFATNPRLLATQQFLSDAPPSDHFVDPDKAVEEARGRLSNSAKKQAQHFNASRYRAKMFTVGHLVAVEDSQLAGGGKLKPKFKGPYTVQTILPNERYLLHRQGRRTTVAAHDQLRPWPSTE